MQRREKGLSRRRMEMTAKRQKVTKEETRETVPDGAAGPTLPQTQHRDTFCSKLNPDLTNVISP